MKGMKNIKLHNREEWDMQSVGEINFEKWENAEKTENLESDHRRYHFSGIETWTLNRSSGCPYSSQLNCQNNYSWFNLNKITRDNYLEKVNILDMKNHLKPKFLAGTLNLQIQKKIENIQIRVYIQNNIRFYTS